MSVAAGTISVT